MTFVDSSATSKGGALETALYSLFSFWRELGNLISDSNSFIFLFLVAQPLLDLTWSWRFFKISEQEINIQTIVGLILLALNLKVGLFGARRHGLPRIVGLFLVFALFSASLTLTSWGINEAIRLFTGLSFFFSAGFLLCDETKFLRFGKLFLASLSVPVLLSYLEIAGVLPYQYWDWIDGVEVGRVTGGYEHPLGLIYFLIYAIPVALVLLTHPRVRHSDKMLVSIFIAAAFGSIIFSFHRVGLVVAFLDVLLWLVLTGRKGMLLFAALALGCLFLVFLPWIQDLYVPLTSSLAGADPASGEFMRGRGLNWFLFLNSLFSSHPFYWFVGKGGSVPTGWENLFDNLSPNEPHSDFIRLLHAYGFIGLFLYLWILGRFTKIALYLRRDALRFHNALGECLLLSVFGVLVLSFTSEPSRYPSGISYLFALGAAAFISASRASRPLTGPHHDEVS